MNSDRRSILNIQAFYSKQILSTIIFSIFYLLASAQNVNQLVVDQIVNGRTLGSLITSFEEKYELDFIFEDQSVLDKEIQWVTEPMTLIPFLKSQLPGKIVKLQSPQIILVLDKLKDKAGTLPIRMVKTENGMISGTIFDELTQSPIIGATILLMKSGTGVLTDIDGKFTIKAESALVPIEVSYIGYGKQQFLLTSSPYSKENQSDISLDAISGQLETVLVKAKKSDSNVSDQRTGIQQLQMKSIKQLPTFLGEIDPIKGVTTLPGVSSTGDLAAGFNVRGGENSQNLILQDGAIIFNPTHLFGFFSAFNPDFINTVSLLKGGGPATYGGRVSSVLDINTRNGDLNKYSLSGGVGLVSSRLTLEGPIQKNKSSFILGGRLSYSTWFIQSYEDIQLKKSFANFHDLSAKLFQRIDDKNYISVTGYYSYDDFNFGIDSTFIWYTQNVSVKWDHIYNKQNRSHLTFASSNYTSEIQYADDIFGFNYQNGVHVLSGNYRYELELKPGMKWEAGMNTNFSKVNPGGSTPYSETSHFVTKKLNHQKIVEPSLFIDGSFDWNERWGLSAGLRYGQFFRLGEDEIYELDYTDIEGRTASITNTLNYGKNEIVSFYHGLEPRVSLRYKLKESISLKAGYYRTQQFLHQVSTTNSPSPVDFWISSSPNILPQVSDQVSIGYFQNFYDDNIESSIECFYKETQNTIDYISGVDFDLNQQYEAGLEQGTGSAYGLEFFLKKKEGRINGWLAYTFSRSYRKFEGKVPELAINDGKRYPSVYDQPHQLSVVMNYQLSTQATLSANFTYNSGRPLTIPISKYSYDNVLSVNNYSERNEYRGPDYHRLDISLQLKSKEKPGRKYYGDFILSLYNVYGRKNAYAIYFDNVGQAFKTSILGNIVPSISYNYKINQ